MTDDTTVTADDAPAGSEAAAQHEYLQPSPAHSRRPFVVASAALLVLATFLGVVAAGYRGQLQDERDERREVESVAAQVATALLTYDYRDLEASKRRVLEHATGTFRREYERAFETSLSVLIEETRAQSKGTVTDLFTGDIRDSTANVLAVVNSEREGVGGRVPVAASYIQLDLVKVGKAWKVDNVTNLNFAQATGGGAGPTAPAGATSTSVP